MLLPARLPARLAPCSWLSAQQRLACRPCVRAASSSAPPPSSSHHAGGHHGGSGDGLRMPVIVDVMIVPSDVGASLPKHVAAAVQAFTDNPALKVEPHPMGTLLEGDWDDVLGAVKMATVQLHAEGIARVTSVLKVGTRTDRAG